jgi:hypothetical protein
MKLSNILYTGLALAQFSITSIHAQDLRTIGEYNGVKVGDSFTVEISQNETNILRVDAESAILSQIKTEVKDSVLFIYTEGKIKTDKPIAINIGVKSLNFLDVSGAANVKTINQLKCNSIAITSSGAGDVEVNTKANSIIIMLSGAGNIHLKGITQILDVKASGAGELIATDLEATKVIAKVSGAGNVKVYATQSINADVSGVGSVIYKGNPIEREVSITGRGSVRESKSGIGNETASDTTRFKLGKKKYMIIDEDNSANKAKNYFKIDSLRNYKQKFKHWKGFELGVNGFLDYKNSLDVSKIDEFLELDYSNSYQFGLNILEKDFHLYKNFINLVFGIGFDFNHYAFKNNISLNPDTSYLSATTDAVNYKKNKLNVSYIKAPLLLEINTSKNPKNNFHIAGGVEIAYRIHSVTKQKFKIEDKRYKTEERDDYNLAAFRYSAIARVGYNNVSIFVTYGLNTLFVKAKGPQVYPFTCGIGYSF